MKNSLVNGYSQKNITLMLCLSLACARFVSLLSYTPEGLRGYGDFPNFFQISSLPGWPFFNYWVEFPPLFPFLNALVNRLAGGQQHVYDYLLAILLLAADVGNLYLFTRLARRIHAPSNALVRSGVYLLVLVVLIYTWGYFDPIAVFWMLLGLTLLLEGLLWRSGLALGMGALTKFFPLLALAAAWRRRTWKEIAGLVLSALLPLALLYGLLYLLSPEFTAASLRSQWAKGSWETVWALIDGNIRTGNFGPAAERLSPALVSSTRGNPAVIHPLVSLAVFAGFGLAAVIRFRPRGEVQAQDQQSLALVGLAWSLFLLWSPGWSPQWVLYLLPLVLLVLPERQAVLFSILLVLVNLLEWPVLLSRDLFAFLWAPVVLRTMLHAILAVSFYSIMVKVDTLGNQSRKNLTFDNSGTDGIIN